MSGRILLEVTEFQQTRNTFRHLSGVPRTVMEIGRRLLVDDGLEVVGVYYHAEAGTFFYASDELFDERDDRAPGGSAGFAGLGTARGDFVDRVRRNVTRLGRSGAGGRAYRSLRRSLTVRRGARPVVFESDDTVLVLGAMWSTTALPDALLEAQRERGFHVASLVYDLIPIGYPQFYSGSFPDLYRHYLDRVLEMSQQLFVISESTGRDLARYCAEQGVEQPETHVVYLGDGAVSATTRHRPEGLPDGDFVLAVSTFEPRKNHHVLYQAVKDAQLTGRSLPRVVVVGSPGWLTGDLQHLVRTDPGIRDAFTWLPRATDAELAWLYDNALFTVYPSVVEGWGLPIAEALTHGKFCITCDTSSMPEVGGDLVDYLSPWDARGWAEAIHRYASDPELLAARVARIRDEYRPRSWDATASTLRSALAG